MAGVGWTIAAAVAVAQPTQLLIVDEDGGRGSVAQRTGQ